MSGLCGSGSGFRDYSALAVNERSKTEEEGPDLDNTNQVLLFASSPASGGGRMSPSLAKQAARYSSFLPRAPA